MARVPTVPMRGGPGRIRGAVVDTSPGRLAPAINAAPLREGLTSLGNAVQQMVREDDENRDNITLTKIEGQAKRRAAEEVDKLDPMASDYSDRVGEAYEQIKQDILSNTEFATRDGQNKAELSLEQIKQSGMSLALSHRKEVLSQEAVVARGEREDETLANIRSDPDGYDDYLADFSIDAARLNVNIPKDELAKRAEAFGDKAVVARAEGLALQGRFKEARSFVKENESALSPDQVRFVGGRIRAVENQAKNEKNSKTAAAVADLEISIIDAAGKDDVSRLDMLRGQVEDMNRQGVFEGREKRRVSLIRQIEHARKSAVGANKDLAQALFNLRNNIPMESQKQADLAFKGYMEAMPEGDKADSQKLIDRTANYVASTGYTPSVVQNKMRQAEMTTDPGNLAQAALMNDSIKAADPNADTGAKDRVELTSAAARLFGMSYEDAASRVVQSLPDPKTFDERKKLFPQVFKDFDPVEEVDDLDLGGGDVTDRAAAEYERTVRTLYQLTGDPDLSKKRAADLIRDRFNTTMVGGEPSRIVELPIENQLPAPYNSKLTQVEKASIIDDMVAKKLSEAGIALPKNRPDGVPVWDVVATEKTRRNIAKGMQPEYILRVYSNRGIPVPIGTIPAPTKDEIENSSVFRRIKDKYHDRLMSGAREVPTRGRLPRSTEIPVPEDRPGFFGSQ